VSGPSFPSHATIVRGAFGLVVLAACLSGLLLLAGADPLRALSALVYDAFGERYLVAETIVTAIPLALVGLGIMPALRAGIFTIGSQGQLIAGAALSTAFVQAMAGQNAPTLLAVGLVGGVVGGMAYALLPAVLRAYFQVNEILSTLLLNYIAGFGLLWLLKGPLAAAAQTATPRSDALPGSALLPTLLDGTRLHWGLVFVPLLALALTVWIRRRSGLVYRIFASHPSLAARLGLSPSRAVVTSFLFAGATAGLAGWVQVAGVAHTLYPSVDGGLGFAGILVAVLGGLRPLGILLAALFFAALTTGAQGMQMGTSVPAAIAVVAEGLVLLLLAVSVQARRGKG
jgi:ABC-type uncharacterized transport system permease subunit